MSNNELVTNEDREWALLKRQCLAFSMSNLLPRHIYDGARNENEVLAKALTIAWKGRELGIPPLYALSSITVIQGKPALSAELMLSLVLRKFPNANPEFNSTNESCSLTMTRPGGKPQTFSFSMEDAKRAGLLDKRGPWHSYPRAMLRARVISEACRSLFGDALVGAIYTPEELGAQPIDIEPEIESTPIETQIAPRKEGVSNQPTGNTPGYDERHAAKMNEPCTAPQQAKLYAMMYAIGWKKDEQKAWLMEKFGKESSKDLTKLEIQDAYEQLEQVEVEASE